MWLRCNYCGTHDTAMARNAELKLAIFTSGRRQVDIAEKTGIHESRLSNIINGRAEPNDDEKKAIARVLRRPVEQLFGEIPA